ncbi:TonB-dependent receptor [Hyphomonas adhaerens]|uniref:TonB-dependent receptor n=2 Tax=Hyphomonadaceae TaxID=69657 RepID=UPI0011BF7125|nr:TonB-dependent receptor [Hyphomonas adhaerens]
MKLNRQPKCVLLAGASAAVLSLIQAPAMAQEADAQNTATTVEAAPPAASEPAADSDKRLSVVKVTATRREESILDVPLAVTAISPTEIERQGVADLRALDNLSASFNMNSTQTESQGTSMRIRGVGTTGNNIGLESAVGVFLDGVYLSRPGVALGDLVDLQQIEVLRGPQGTLFGRNTSAGALNITTKAPNLREKDGFANVTAGNYGLVNVQGGFSAPIVEDKFAVRLSGAYRTRDGLVESTTGAESHTRDRWMVRGQALWQITPDAKLRVIADYSDADEQCCDAIVTVDPLGEAGIYAAVGLPANGGVSAFGPRALDSLTSNGEQFQNPFQQEGISAQLDWNLGFADLVYIGSYRDFHAESIQHSEYVSLDVYAVGDNTAPFAAPSVRPSYDDIKTTTHELRLQGQAFNGRLDWLLGTYYSDEDIEERATMTLGGDYGRYVSALLVPALGAQAVSVGFGGNVPAALGGVDPAGSYADNKFNQQGESLSIFTHNVLELTDRLNLTVGLRYVEETKDGSFEQMSASSPACANIANGIVANAYPANVAPLAPTALALTCFPFATEADLPASAFLPLPRTFNDTFEDEELVYTVKLGGSLTENLNFYAGFTHGFKSGGFNLDPTAATGGADPRFDSEKIDATEVGLKGTFNDGRGRFDLAVFNQEMEDFQVLEFTGTQFQTFNVPKVVSKGVEIEVQTQLTDNLSANGALTYTDAYYPNDCAPGGFDPSNPVNRLCGFKLTNAPEWVGLIGLTWESALDNGMPYFLTGTVRSESERRTSTQAVDDTGARLADDIQDANSKLNLRAGISTADDRWTFEIWGNNVTDEQTKNVTFNMPLRGTARGVFIQDPATYGVTLRTRF